MSNDVATKQEAVKISTYLSNDKVQGYLNGVIGSKKDKFVTNLVSAVNQNPSLQTCTNQSLISGALVASTLNLSLNKSFGYAYLVPYHKKDRQGNIIQTDAQFQIGYKGYIQLAMRTGEYQRLNAVPIYKSQFLGWNALTEDLKVNDIDDFQEDEIVGYVSYFRLNNGFEKTMFWSYQKMMKHADTYSQAFSEKSYNDLKAGKITDKDMWKYSSFWYKSFDDMALKTMLRQLLSKYGILSEEMQKAYEFDQSVIVDNKPQYADRSNDDEVIDQIDPLAIEHVEVIEDEPKKPRTQVNLNDVG
jgi:recombination protein RecT